MCNRILVNLITRKQIFRRPNMAKTIEELSSELTTLQTKVKEGKELRAKLALEYKQSQVKDKELRAQIQTISAEIKTTRNAEKLSQKEAHLAELLKAKEEASKLGVRVAGHKKTAAENMPEEAAAHRPIEDVVAEGNLDDPVDIADLEKELDLF
jgi:septal ring factor EnvC (AmiA/AmiB activator)